VGGPNKSGELKNISKKIKQEGRLSRT